jgi:two-component system, response regulator, stage 0 sporulation protein F
LVARMASQARLPPELVERALAARAHTSRQFFGADAHALLPQLQTACAAARREEGPPGPTSTAGKRMHARSEKRNPMPALTERIPAIVLVGAAQDILIVFQQLMHGLRGSYELVSVKGGAEALALIASRSVRLVITKYMIADMTGAQLAAEIKATAPATRVVLITTTATPALEEQAQEAGVDYYLPQPFPLSRLENIVRAALASGEEAP